MDDFDIPRIVKRYRKNNLGTRHSQGMDAND